MTQKAGYTPDNLPTSSGDVGQDAIIAITQSIIRMPQWELIQFLLKISTKSCGLIRQVALNVLLNKEIYISEQDKKYFKKQEWDIKHIASKNICVKDKRKLLPSKYRLIKKLANVVYMYLAQ